MRVRYFSALAALAIIGAGCGSSSSSSSSSSNGNAGTSSSSATASSSAAKPAARTVAITTKEAKKLGTILAGGNKRLSVYVFEADKGAVSRCTGACAGVWPPVTGNPHASGGAVAANLGTITRSGGATQVTYKGHPLYFYIKDKDDGDTYGQGIKSFGADWYVLSPAGSKVDTGSSSPPPARSTSSSTRSMPSSTSSKPSSTSGTY